MNYWKATYGFEHPPFDRPIKIGHLTILPAMPRSKTGPSCIHFYEFQTPIGKNDYLKAKELALRRYEELIELSVLSKYASDVRFMSLVLINREENSFSRSRSKSISIDFELKEYTPAMSYQGAWEELNRCNKKFKILDTLANEPKTIVGRSLRWRYKSDMKDTNSDDKLIYGWISFNILYSSFINFKKIKQRSERVSFKEFDNYFKINTNSKDRSLTTLANANLFLSRGKNKNVSENLKRSLNTFDDMLTENTLDCVYAVRCSLFHGERKPQDLITEPVVVAASNFINGYILKAIPKFIDFCTDLSR